MGKKPFHLPKIILVVHPRLPSKVEYAECLDICSTCCALLSSYDDLQIYLEKASEAQAEHLRILLAVLRNSATLCGPGWAYTHKMGCKSQYSVVV